MQRWERRSTKSVNDALFMLHDWKGSTACFPTHQLAGDMEAATKAGQTARLYDMAGMLMLNGYPDGTWYMAGKVYGSVYDALAVIKL